MLPNPNPNPIQIPISLPVCSVCGRMCGCGSKKGGTRKPATRPPPQPGGKNIHLEFRNTHNLITRFRRRHGTRKQKKERYNRIVDGWMDDAARNECKLFHLRSQTPVEKLPLPLPKKIRERDGKKKDTK